MTEITGRGSKAFANIRTMQSRYERLPADQIRCPICWGLFDVRSMSREHVPPQSVKTLVGEEFVPDLLTCAQCNNDAGSSGQDDLKLLVTQQHWSKGAYLGELPATLSHNDVSLKVNVSMSSAGGIHIVGVPKANDLGRVEASATGFPDAETFALTFSFHRSERAAWALLHSAYHMLVAKTNYLYAYSRAGTEFRSLLSEKEEDVGGLQNYCLPTRTAPALGPAGLVVLEKSKTLKCYLVKIAGQLVPMPLPNDGINLFRRWWRRSSVDYPLGRTQFVLRPRLRRIAITLDQGNAHLLQHLPFELGYPRQSPYAPSGFG